MASPKKRGWGLGLFRGGKNNDNDNNADTKPELEKNQASASQTADDSTQSQTPTNNNPLHPPSPKSVSPQTTISTSKKAIVPGKSKKNKKSNSKKKKKDDSQQNDSSTATKIREKRRKKVFKKIEWYEEDLQERVSIDGIDSLSKDDVIALGLFNTQRLGKDELSDEELERLLVLADRCKQAKKDETELEVDDEVDMDRTYHLELLSRQRMGEILTDEENEELQYLEQKRQDKTDLLDLEWKKKNGDDDVDEVRLNELSLLDRKRKGDKAMTEEENEELQLLELRREDARINQKDFNEILQLKEKGEDVDEDRFYLLNLLDRKRCKVDISEEENNIVEDYFTLRDDEHFDNIETTMLLDKRDRGEENSVDAERISELIEILADKEDRELNKVDNDHCSKKDSINDEGDSPAVDDSFNEDEFDELLTRKEQGETVDENRLYELELLFRQRQGEDLTEDELMDLDLFQLQRTDDNNGNLENSKQDENVNNVSTFGEGSLSPSELLGLKEFELVLKQNGLPLKITFTPFSEENESDISIVSHGDESYIKDLVNQRTYREDERKEECLEDAFKLYKSAVNAKKVPENEETLLAIFADVLKEKNEKMRKKDKEFKELVDKVLAQQKLRKQKAEKEARSEKVTSSDEIAILSDEKGTKTNALEGAKRKIKVEAIMEQEEQSRHQTVNESLTDADNDDKMVAIIQSKKTEQQPKIAENSGNDSGNNDSQAKRGWGLGLFQRSATISTNSDEISQTEETENVTKEEPQYPLPREGPDLQIDARESEIDNSEREEIKEETSDNKDAIDVVDKLTPISTEGSRSMDEKLNVRVDQEVEAIIFDASLAKDNAVSENAALVETPQTMKIVLVEEEKKNSEATVHDIFELDKCETESFSKNTGKNSTHSGIDYVGNDIQYNKLVERLQSGESLEEDEEYELELLERIKQGEDLLEDEIEELKWLKQIREQLQSGQDEDDKKLTEQIQIGEVSHELQETESLEYTRQDNDLQDFEIEETNALRQLSEHEDTNKKDIHNLHQGVDNEFDLDKDLGHEPDNKYGIFEVHGETDSNASSDQEHEKTNLPLGACSSIHDGEDGNDIQYNKLMERLQSGESLEEDEEYELELLERIKQGEDLLEDEIEELKWLKQIREQLQSGQDEDDKKPTEQFQTGKVSHELQETESLEYTRQDNDLQDLEIEETNALRQLSEHEDTNKKNIYNLDQGVDNKFDLDKDLGHELDNKYGIFEAPSDQEHKKTNLPLGACSSIHDGEDGETLKIDITNPRTRGEEPFDKEDPTESNPVTIISDGGMPDAEERENEEEEDENKNDNISSPKVRGEEMIDEEDQSESNPTEIISDDGLPDAEVREEYSLLDSRGDIRMLAARGGDIDKDLLYELELLTRMRDGEQLSDRQSFELKLLRRTREGEAISETQIAELQIFKRDRIETILDEEYLRDLLDRNSRGEAVNEDLLYEVELFHRNLNGETLSEDELLELYLFERRIDGNKLNEDDLDELDLLGQKRLDLRSIDGQSDKVENIMVEDDDSVYRRDLTERQMAGKRLDKKEFQWLQILMKKYRNEELLEDDLDELEIMRNQRNETSVTKVEFVNTRRLLEEELRKKAKREQKEKRRIEKEERREQRKKRIEQKQMTKKLRRKKKTKREGDQATRISEGDRGTQPPNEKQLDGLPSLGTAHTVQIIGSPPVQHLDSKGGEKEEIKRGVFGGVFGNRNKDKKKQQLEDARRMQEELIKEQMKALALDNEVEGLEREKVMQEQLVQETIDKKKADESIGSSSWETDTADKDMEGEDDSSLSSWDSSVSSNSSESEEIFVSKKEEIILNKINYKAGNEDNRGNQVDYQTKLKHVDSASPDIAGFPTESSYKSKELTQPPPRNASGPTIPEPVSVSVGEKTSDQSTSTGKPGIPSREEKPRSANIKKKTKSFTLGAHLRKQKKKSRSSKTKYGDDVSLGTLQLSKSIKEDKSNRRRRVKIHPDDANKIQERPWIAATNLIDVDQSNIQGITIKNENEKPSSTSISDSSYQLAQSFISRIPEEDAEVEAESVTSLHLSNKDLSNKSSNIDSSNKEGDFDSIVEDVDAEAEAEADADAEAEAEVEQSMHESNSLTSLGDEVYDLGLQEYEIIESRLAGKLESKKAEFDTTWENVVADENVIVQINQRLRERKRAKESTKDEKKQDKKEEKESNGLQDVPRLFLFEGEKVNTKNRSRNRKKQKAQKKLDRTLTKEFRKAMQDVFDSDSDDDYRHKFDDDDDDEIQDYHIGPTATRIQSVDDHLSIYDDPSEKSVSEHGSADSDEGSVKFDGGYLQRLQARSMPQDVKRMLSGRNLMSHKSVQSESSGDLSLSSDEGDYKYHSTRRMLKRKKDGELAIDDIDPAEVYAQALEKMKEKKTFTIADLRKEMEDDLNQQQNNAFSNNIDRIGGGGFGIKPIAPLRIKKAKIPKPKNDITFGTSLSKGPESLQQHRQRSGRSASSQSQRSVTSTGSNRGLLTGARKKKLNGLLPPGTIQEDDGEEEEEEDAFLTGRLKSEEFGAMDSFKGNMNNYRTKIGAKARLPNLPKFFGNAAGGISSNGASSITMPMKNPFNSFKAKKSSPGGGLLDVAENGGGSGSGYNNNSGLSGAFHSDAAAGGGGGFLQEPLQVPGTPEGDRNNSKRAYSIRSGVSVLKAMGSKVNNSKSLLGKFKLPGGKKKSNFGGGGLMMDDDYDDDNYGGGEMGLLGQS